MPLNVTVHAPLASPQGVLAAAPTVDLNTSSFTVALGAQSVAINGPALLLLNADEDERVTVTQTLTYAPPAATGYKLRAGADRFVNLSSGTWYINVAAG